MTARIPVVTALAEFRVAIAGLPFQAQPADDPTGAIVVVDGSGRWWDAAAIAVGAGASAVLVAEPREVPLDAVGDLAEHADVPIVVHRSRLRHDLLGLAVEQREGVAPRVVVSECRATGTRLPQLVRDAVGWMRGLAETPLTVAAAAATSDGGTALLRSRIDDRVVGSMLTTATRREGTFLRVQALGETTTEFELDEPAGRSELSTSTSRGRLVAPARYEAGERAALRRAVESVVEQRLPRDLAHLLHDAEAAFAIVPFVLDSRSLVDIGLKNA